jgi:Mg-chelatase subunit ChlD
MSSSSLVGTAGAAPVDLDCPITGVRFVDPVVAMDGNTYERAAIQNWFDRCRAGAETSPITRAVIGTTLITNYDKRRQLDSSMGGGAAAAAAATAAAAAAAAVIGPFVSARPSIGARRFVGKNGKHYLQLQATVTAADVSTNGTDYIFSVDISGSMESVAWVKVDKGEMGVTRLGLSKHLIKTVAAMLTDRDRVAIVSFNEVGRKVLDLTPMTDSGRQLLNQRLERLEANNCTHLYGGVEEAAKIASSDSCRGRRIVGILLTDGVPTESIPPVDAVRGRTTMPMIQERIKVLNPWSFHTIGFSSDINSGLLEQLARWGNGRMLFVPSGDMVSTNGINLTAFEKTVASLGTTVSYNLNGVRNTLVTGPLGLKQRRDFVIPLEPSATVDGVVATEADVLADLGSVEVADCRNDLVETLTAVIETHSYKSNGYANPALQAELDGLLLAFHGRHAAVGDPSVKAILRDVVKKVDGEGQLRLALQFSGTADWGIHYLRAYRDHMAAGVCMNFKDPGLKTFETPEFLAFQAAGDTAFASIPAPALQRKADAHADAAARAALYTMNVSSAFNNSSGSCFEGSMPVRMADGKTTKAVRDIRKGDQVYTMFGPATVLLAAEFNSYQPSQPMVQLTSQICVTAWHPCRNKFVGSWDFPSNIVQFQARPIQTVYNLVLDRGHIIESGDYQFVTLGHGFQEGILKHAWFGGQEVVKALEAQPGGDVGRPVYTNLVAIKDETTGLIVRWIDQV